MLTECSVGKGWAGRIHITEIGNCGKRILVFPSIYFYPGFLFLSNEAGASFLSATFFVFLVLGINGGPAGEDGSGQSAARSEFAADHAALRANVPLAPQIYLAFIFSAV